MLPAAFVDIAHRASLPEIIIILPGLLGLLLGESRITQGAWRALVVGSFLSFVPYKTRIILGGGNRERHLAKSLSGLGLVIDAISDHLCYIYGSTDSY